MDVILTSCGRFDLLKITLDSFFELNTYPISNFFIYEDGPENPLEKDYPQIKFIIGGTRKGQIVALDTLWSLTKTDYVFTLEDDWKFLKKGFIENSLEILENHPTCLQVRMWYEEYGQQPLREVNGVKFFKTEPNLWAAINFNPSVRRKKDYDLIAPFSSHTTFNRDKPWKSEAVISKIYHKLGFKAALMDGYITHIGNERHVN